MKSLKEENGVIFDLRKDKAESFVENFKLLKEREPRKVDFEVKICSKMPNLKDSYSGYGSKRREGGGGGGGGYGGSRRD